MYRLVLAWQVFDAPVIVAANRDGRGDAPTRPLTTIRKAPHAVVSHAAGVEETVLGYNEHGVVVFLARRSGAGRTVSLRDVLGCRSAETAVRTAERAVEPGSALDLLVVDATAALSLEANEGVAVHPLAPGVHAFVGADIELESGPEPESDPGPALGSDGFDRAHWESRDDRWHSTAHRFDTSGWLRDTLQPEPGETTVEWLDRAADALGDHDHDVCVHAGLAAGVETCSSSLLVVGADGTITYRYADGPPCRTPYRSVG